MICSYCATELPRGAMFCGECGSAVVGAVASKRETPVMATAPTRVEELVEIVMPEPAAAVLTAPESLEEQVVAAVDDIGSEEGEVASALESVDPVEGVDLTVPDLCAQCGAALAPDDIFCGDCGFVRQGSGAARPRDTVSLDPFPWGASAGSGVPALREEPVPTFDDDIDETRIVDRSARGDRFVLQFSTGDSVSVTGTGLLGRNPVAEPGEYFDSLVTISDPGKSVSKTHLEFGQDGGTFWISDRYSGNGTVVRQPETQARRCEAGKRYRVVRGTRVDIGEQFFIVS